jgi:hypothetical protein
MAHFLGSSIPSEDLDNMIVEAERFMRLGENREAIRHWIKIASILGDRTPENIYHRLGDAYALNRESFGGTLDENQVWGDRDKHKILADLHAHLKPELYLEIGVDQGVSLSLATGRAIGVDARPKLKLTRGLGDHATLVALSSDAFFREQAKTMLSEPPALVFIDGMHLFEFALRDFMNVERFASPATLVIIDDVFPCHPAQATRLPRTDSWAGDVWKLHGILREERPELILISLNAIGTGLLLIAGLDPANNILWDKYGEIVENYAKDIDPPTEVLTRRGALPSDSAILPRLLSSLKLAWHEGWSSFRLRETLRQLAA